MLARSGLLGEMTDATQHCPQRHARMRATGGRRVLGAFNVESPLRQTRVLAPLQFDAFLTAVPGVGLQQFSDDMEIIADRVALHEPAAEKTTERPEEAEDPLPKVLQAVWGMPYADDAGSSSPSSQGLAKMMVVIVKVSKSAGFDRVQR